MLHFLVRQGEAPPSAGNITGPHCVYSSTLPAKHSMIPLPPTEKLDSRIQVSAFDIPESCLWEPEHPFLYKGAFRVAENEIPLSLGLRSFAIRQGQLLLNSRPYWFRGRMETPVNEEQLQRFHQWGCNLLVPRQPVSPEAITLTDRFGPFLATALTDFPQTTDTTASDPAGPIPYAFLEHGGPCHPSLGIWWSKEELSTDLVNRIRAFEPSSLFARWIPSHRLPSTCSADLIFVEGNETALPSVGPSCQCPWIAVVEGFSNRELDEATWREASDRLDVSLANAEGCIGWVIDG
ncbi:MAG: hypothetical protein U1D30_02970 [Planctomycetota bacterium]